MRCTTAQLFFIRDEPDPHRVLHQARHVMDAQPLHQLRPVRLHGLDAQVECERDLLGGVALSHTRQNVPLPGVSGSTALLAELDARSR